MFRFMNLRMISHVQFERVIDQLLFNIGEPKHGFLMQSRPVDWKFICEFYDVDSSKTSRMAPKLTCVPLQYAANQDSSAGAQTLGGDRHERDGSVGNHQ